MLCWPRSSNGAYVYKSINRGAYRGRWPVFLYLYRDPKTAELVWVFGCTIHDKPEDVNDPRYRPNTKDQYDADPNNDAFALFDSSPSAKGACALNGPATPRANGVNAGVPMASAMRTRARAPSGTVRAAASRWWWAVREGTEPAV